jgi:2-polyprenyl-6-methoxyphenol hydroxylase-like FAD-dependent oxidoreductase
MDGPRALIIGGSVGGLFAAHLLRASGWDVTVFERSRGDLADRGASIGTRDDLFKVMRRIGIDVDPSVGVAVRSRICLDRQGKIIHELPTKSMNSSWDRVYRPLRALLPDDCLRVGMPMERLEQSPDSVTAIFADGTRESGDLLIGADGIHSTVRAQLMPEVQPRYAGYVAWRGVIDEGALTPQDHALLYGRMSFCLPLGELVLALGMPGRGDETRPGLRRFYWIWFRAANPEKALPRLCTDAAGKCHGTSIPPALVRPEIIRELHAAASAKLAPPLAAVIKRTPLPFPHGIFDLDSPRLVFGRVALLGDAAFVARPHVGAGVTKAALDAQGLADALAASSDLATALARYERERLASGQNLVDWSRHLGAYLEACAKPDGSRRHVFMVQQPEIVLAEYGAAGKSA